MLHFVVLEICKELLIIFKNENVSLLDGKQLLDPLKVILISILFIPEADGLAF